MVSHYFNLQYHPDIRPHKKWAVSLVIADNLLNLPLGLVCIGMYGLIYSLYHLLRAVEKNAGDEKIDQSACNLKLVT